MKKFIYLVLIICLSFLSACVSNNFPKNDKAMITTTIPGGSIQLGGNPVWIDVATTLTGVSKHQLLIRLISVDGKVPGGPWIDSIDVYNGSARFNISALVDYEFDYNFDIEHLNRSFSRDLLTAQFTIESGETYRDAAGDDQEDWSGVINNLTILKGKLTNTELASLNNANTSFYEYYITGMRFLSDMNYNEGEAEKVIYVNNETDPVKAWLCIFDVQPDFILVLNKYTDGDYDESQLAWWQTGANQFAELNLDVLAAQNRTSLNEGKDIDFYVVIARYNNGDMGRIKVKVTNKYSENHEVLYCINALGAVEAINCYGEVSEIRSSEKETYTRPAAYSPSIFEATLKAVVNSNSISYKVNTGFKSLNERRWIAKLLTSEQAWFKSHRLQHLIGKDYGFVPVVIKDGSISVDTTSNDLLSIEFEIETAHFE